jgi:hypothetical protein
VKLEIWYQQQTANDYSEGNPAITVATVEELDAFVDRVDKRTRRAPSQRWRTTQAHIARPHTAVTNAGRVTHAHHPTRADPRHGRGRRPQASPAC